jgi:hypothetical protein
MYSAFRLSLLGVPALSCSLVVAATLAAQPAVSPEVQGLYKACMDNATSTHNIIQTGDRLIYACGGGPAQNYFEYLVSKNSPQSVDKQPTGTYYFREIPEAGRCWNKVEHVDGVETSYFGCSINVAKGAAGQAATR